MESSAVINQDTVSFPARGNLLQGRVAIVTGGNGGLGGAMAMKFAEEGARVVLAARTLERLKETEDKILEMGSEALSVETDVSDADQVERLVEETLGRFGQIDILVNNAGISGPTKLLADVGLEEWNQTLAVNLTGSFLAAKAVLPHMVQRRTGNIINVSSIFGKRGYPYRSPYSASKWALIGLTQTLAMEVGRHNIRVNAICPGPIQGNRIERVWKERARVRHIPWQVIQEKMIRMSALRRIPLLQEAADLACFLASDQSSAMTGQALNLSAGTEMR